MSASIPTLAWACDAMSINPYASPLADCSPSGNADEHTVRRRMLVAIRLYWWMGVISLVFYSGSAIALSLAWLLGRDITTYQFVAQMVFDIGAIGASAASIHVARGLRRKPHGMLRRARLVAIILATIWFPILTVPAIMCMRRVTAHFEAYCSLMLAGSERQMKDLRQAPQTLGPPPVSIGRPTTS